MSAHEASHRALAQFSGSVQQQAGVLSFQSAFWVMGFTVMFLIPLPFIMERPEPERDEGYCRAALILLADNSLSHNRNSVRIDTNCSTWNNLARVA